MHPEAVFANPACGDQVRAHRIVLRQICGEVHFLPFKDLLDVLSPWEAELPQVPAFDEVNLAIPGALIDLVWMPSESKLDLVWEEQRVSAVVAEHECVLLTCQPSVGCWKLHDAR